LIADDGSCAEGGVSSGKGASDGSCQNKTLVDEFLCLVKLNNGFF